MRYIVRGRVQGVGFRWWCRRVADELGVRGSVRNRADGTVEIVAAADPQTLASFEDRLRAGPSMARVEGVEAESSSEPVAGEDFVIAS